MANPVAHTFQSKELSNLTAVMNQNGKHEPRVVEFFLRCVSTTHFIQYVSAIIFSNKLLPTVFWARLFCNYFEHIAWTFVLERDSWTHLSKTSGSFFNRFWNKVVLNSKLTVLKSLYRWWKKLLNTANKDQNNTYITSIQNQTQKEPCFGPPDIELATPVFSCD